MGIVRRRSTESGVDRWTDVEAKVYRGAEGPRGIKQILLGPDDGAPNFAIRIFQVAPGKSSNEEEHPWDHGVFIQQGRARVLLGERVDEVKAGDFVWIEPNERHRLDSLGPETLQFLCVVPDWGEPDAKNRPPAPGTC